MMTGLVLALLGSAVSLYARGAGRLIIYSGFFSTALGILANIGLAIANKRK
jgi:hypothetical protein